MHRFLSFVRHASEAKPSVQSYGGVGVLRSLGSSLGSPFLSKCFSGLPQNKGVSLIGISQSFENAEHVRGFSSTNSWGNNRTVNGNASHGFYPDSQMNTNSHGFNPDSHRNTNSHGFNPDSQRNTNSHGFNPDSQRNRDSHGFNPDSQMNTNSHGFNPDAQRNPNPSSQNDAETRKSSTPMDYVRGILEMDGNGVMGDHRFSGPTIEHDADFVHIKLLRNNTFVTVTDKKGNIKLNASAGCLKEMKGGQKLSRYAAEATAEEVGRRARKLGLKSVVMKVKGLTYFKKKRQAIVSWREGFTESKSICPIVYIEDATRRPHNGCRRPKRRRI